ncbi:MAG: quinone-dependent dihydroorotate dehydrogenase [Candidatus Hodarchaeales archaeon]
MTLFEIARTVFFQLDPEFVHDIVFKSSHILRIFQALKLRIINYHLCFPRRFMGIDFFNSVGLAAGMDKNGDYLSYLSGFGFGHIEVGTVTPRPQKGNPKPRIFRITENKSIINRMGFNNKGVNYLVNRLQKHPFDGTLGVSIGKNADTPIEQAVVDYVYCMEKVYDLATYITINISSPNTKNLRNLQYCGNLSEFLYIIMLARARLQDKHGKHTPIVLKISPDLQHEEIKKITELVVKHKVDGVIATNTTTQRPGFEQNKLMEQVGGLSGAPLKNLSVRTVQALYDEFKGEVPIIGCGGIMSGHDALNMVNAGANLVQIFTGFVYQGPSLVKEIVRTLDLNCWGDYGRQTD